MPHAFDALCRWRIILSNDKTARALVLAVKAGQHGMGAQVGDAIVAQMAASPEAASRDSLSAAAASLRTVLGRLEVLLYPVALRVAAHWPAHSAALIRECLSDNPVRIYACKNNTTHVIGGVYKTTPGRSRYLTPKLLMVLQPERHLHAERWPHLHVHHTATACRSNSLAGPSSASHSHSGVRLPCYSAC